jgi:hypothetical protein
MEPTLTSELIPGSLEDPIAEIQDFDRVVQFYWPRILRFILASVRDRDVAETLTQDCFWNAYRGRKSFRGDSTLQTWLMRNRGPLGPKIPAKPSASVLAARPGFGGPAGGDWRLAARHTHISGNLGPGSTTRFERFGMPLQVCPNGKGQCSCFASWKT